MSMFLNMKGKILIFSLISISIVWIESGFCGISNMAAEASKNKIERLEQQNEELLALVKREEAIAIALDKTEELIGQENKEISAVRKEILAERETSKPKEQKREAISIEPKKGISAEGVILEKKEAPKKRPRREVIIEPQRPGFERYYEEGIGFKVTDFLGISTYTEIFEEPNPTDDYIGEAKFLNRRDEDSMRDMLTHLFTRSVAARVTFEWENWPRFTYTFDKREVLHEFDTKYGIKDQEWQTQEASILYTFPEIRYLGAITVNPVYKRIALSSDDDTNTAEDRNEYMLNLTLSPCDDIDIFFKADYYEGKKLNTDWISKPEQWLYKGELRFRFPEYKLSLTPSYSYSQVRYLPTDDIYSKQEVALDIGKDLTKKLKASLRPELVLSEERWPELSSTGASNVEAGVVGVESELSYNVFKDFYINGSLDWSHGIHFDHFDNAGLGLEIEYFKPTFLRWKIGYKKHQYYHLHDNDDTLYFKIYFFM